MSADGKPNKKIFFQKHQERLSEENIKARIEFILDGVNTTDPAKPLIIKQNSVVETGEETQSYNPHALCSDGIIHIKVNCSCSHACFDRK